VKQGRCGPAWSIRVKAASDVYTPVSGTVTESNAALEDEPELVNSDAETGGWLFRLTLSDPAELAGLMDQAAYDATWQGCYVKD
jgi:glycine cleavage system H protein